MRAWFSFEGDSVTGRTYFWGMKSKRLINRTMRPAGTYGELLIALLHRLCELIVVVIRYV
jgi:hypothetical protein